MKRYLTYLLLLVCPLFGYAQSPTASSSLRIQVIVPAVLEVVKNDHPLVADGISIQQLTLRSNSRTTCVTLQTSGHNGVWQTAIPGGIWSVTEGWSERRFCTQARGTLELILVHDFSKRTDHWPLRLLVAGQP
jgi:hypothetical protein